MGTKVVPYADAAGKKEQIERMFDSVASKYDILNRVLSGWIDIYWRKVAIGKLKALAPKQILDIATGTGDLSLEAYAQLKPQSIKAVDISEGMMALGREKIAKKNLSDVIKFQREDSENLSFDSNSFDAVIVSFGVRNFENLLKGLSEMHRVTKPGGQCMILEFSSPTSFPFKQLFWFYSTKILPLIGRMISKDPAAYTYLPESVKAFPFGEEFLSIFREAGFKTATISTLTFGLCSIYIGTKD